MLFSICKSFAQPNDTNYHRVSPRMKLIPEVFDRGLDSEKDFPVGAFMERPSTKISNHRMRAINDRPYNSAKDRIRKILPIISR